MDSLGNQHHAKKLSPKIALHFKVLCESKATLPIICNHGQNQKGFSWVIAHFEPS